MKNPRHPGRTTRYTSKRSLRRLRITSSILVSYLVLPSPASAAAGQLDPSFGDEGKVATSFANGALAAAVAIQPNARIVAAGSTFADPNQLEFALARYSPTGRLDRSFDVDGRVTTDFGGSDGIAGVALQADGRIVAAGGTDAGVTDDFALARYNPDGSLDQSFDGDGRVTTDFGVDESGSAGAAIQADGKIVAAGFTQNVATQAMDFALARYNPDGSLDQSFHGDGKVTTDFGGFDQALGVVTLSDERIVVVGVIDNDDFALARYNPNGSLDQSFDGDGKVTTDFGSFDIAVDVAIEADGKIVAAGSTFGDASGQDFAVARYNPDGTLDQSFDFDGMVTTDFGGDDGNQAALLGVAIQRNGKIVVAGRTLNPADPFEQDFALARYNPDGSLDEDFDGDGRVTTDFGGVDNAGGVDIQQGGKAVAAGFSSPDGTGGRAVFALARYRSG
jgi:uncharacterized delta-60 repeat protein